MPRLLIVDDEEVMQELFEQMLVREGYQMDHAYSAEEALGRVDAGLYDLVLLDLALPGADGLDLLQELKRRDPDLPAVVVTAYGTIESAVRAMRQGAFDYLPKPFDRDEIAVVLEKALAQGRLSREVRRLREAVEEQGNLQNIVGRSKKMLELFRAVRRVAPSTATILLEGESGTGKELLARALHAESPRKDAPFVPINCSTLPEPLLESELFGHVRGAFTGATSSKKGLFAEAHGGTILLDEIGDLSPAVQTKLLRVLQEREIKPVGGTETIPVDVRVVAATNVPLRAAVEARRFREDLYFRLAVVPLRVPPLRERREDIPLLVHHFLRRHAERAGEPVKRIHPRALERLVEYDWPGNVREVENMVERLVLFSDSFEITHEEVPRDLFRDEERTLVPGDAEFSLGRVAERSSRAAERRAILAALDYARGNRSAAAAVLRVSRGTLYRHLRRLGLDSPARRGRRSRSEKALASGVRR
ncbi:MAG: sigma-54 dependent transcriptional regulator [Planctomycetales bacterium]|nr:sigma-54 dependent transcriptional regulator [Planctomycetales bacterium]